MKTSHHITNIGPITRGLDGLDVGWQSSQFAFSQKLTFPHFIKSQRFPDPNDKAALEVGQGEHRSVINSGAMQQLQTIPIQNSV
mmetsp:Transcript_106531/g.308312  ORF Transcript_106531/g.308312 Transcript_106531/m.308312 type:complete len:84 (-) Transcript_106531:2359-2610(-)